ncbi:hypothetical protein [Pseudonocardia spinosispora]|uniref:hypothetical protein n=1 Tax=Pseudonocardia spinosispora TaxID=103441 RepID=UPI0003FBF8F9|nr:hypothetical protein [Pseudonocardia spinosispora]
MDSNIVAGLTVAGAVAGVLVWWAGARAGRAAERAWRQVIRTWAVAGVAVVIGAGICGVQWLVMTRTPELSIAAVLLVFGIPAVLAGASLARLITVTALISQHDRRGHRRGRAPKKSRRN